MFNELQIDAAPETEFCKKYSFEYCGFLLIGCARYSNRNLLCYEIRSPACLEIFSN
jgi:hypothetical protein